MGKLTELASPWRAYPHLYFSLAVNRPLEARSQATCDDIRLTFAKPPMQALNPNGDADDQKLEAKLTDIAVQAVLTAEIAHRQSAQRHYECSSKPEPSLRRKSATARSRQPAPKRSAWLG